MKRPAFMFYPGDWQRNANLRRCSMGARGAWIDILCLMHDADEYGVLRWPMKEVAQAAGVPLALVKELAAKGVLKGADSNASPFVFTPSHAGKDGTPVVLVEANGGPVWYSSRFVRDEWVRLRRGSRTRFSADNQPPKGEPNQQPNIAPNPPPNPQPNSIPNPPIGGRQGDGLAFAVALKEKERNARGKLRAVSARQTLIPIDFGISDEVRRWAEEKGYGDLDRHLEHFRGWAISTGKTYASWDQTFMNCIRDDWGEVRGKRGAKPATDPTAGAL